MAPAILSGPCPGERCKIAKSIALPSHAVRRRNFNWPASRVCICGMGGVGKTTLFLHLLERERADYFFVFDHKHEIGKKMGWRYCLTFDELVAATARGGAICFDPCVMFPGEKLKAATFFFDFAYSCSSELDGRKLLACDELDQLHSKYQRPDELMLCLSDARYYQMDFLAVGQATNSLHNEVSGQMTEFYTFHQFKKNAIEGLEEYGFEKNEVRALRPGEWLRRRVDSPETIKGGTAFQIKSSSRAGARALGERSALERSR